MIPGCRFGCRRKGFTLIELIVTMVLIGTVALLIFPRIGAETGNETILLQRAVYEAMNITSGGTSLRLTVGPKGRLICEVLETDKDGNPVWKRGKLKWLPSGEGWESESGHPFLVFQDGTCTPWSVRFTEKMKKVDYLISVVGHVYETKGSPSKRR